MEAGDSDDDFGPVPVKTQDENGTILFWVFQFVFINIQYPNDFDKDINPYTCSKLVEKDMPERKKAKRQLDFEKCKQILYRF